MSTSITISGRISKPDVILSVVDPIDDRIEQFIELLTLHKPNIIQLSYNTCGPKAAMVIADVLTNPNCYITSLSIKYEKYDEHNGLDSLTVIADAIAKNTSLYALGFSIYNSGDGFDEFTRRLAKSIKFHPSLKYLNLTHNNSVYISDVIRCLPKSLTELYLYGCSLNIDDFACLGQNTHLKSLTVCCSDDMLKKICLNKYKTILTNKMLTYFRYFSWGLDTNKQIEAMLTQNRNARDAAIRAARCFIAIRIFRRSECDLLGRIDINNVLAIAKYVIDSYGDDAWSATCRYAPERTVKKPSIKRSRRSKK